MMSPDRKEREGSKEREREKERSYERETEGDEYYAKIAREAYMRVRGGKDESSPSEREDTREGSEVEEGVREREPHPDEDYSRLARETYLRVLGKELDERSPERVTGRAGSPVKAEVGEVSRSLERNDEDLFEVRRCLSGEDFRRAAPKVRGQVLEHYHRFLDNREEILEKLRPDALSEPDFRDRYLNDKSKLAEVRRFLDGAEGSNLPEREPEKYEEAWNRYEELLNKRYDTLAGVEPKPKPPERALRRKDSKPEPEKRIRFARRYIPEPAAARRNNSKPESTIHITGEGWVQKKEGDEKSVVKRAAVSGERDGNRFKQTVQTVRSESPLGDTLGFAKSTEVRAEKKVKVTEDSVRRIWWELSNTRKAFVTRTDRLYAGVLEPEKVDRSRTVTVVDRGERKWLKNVDYAAKTEKWWVDEEGVTCYEQCMQAIGHRKTKKGETDVWGAAVTDRFRFGEEKDEKISGETTFIQFDPRATGKRGEAEKRESESKPSLETGTEAVSEGQQETVLKFYRNESDETPKNAHVEQVSYKIIHEPPEETGTNAVEKVEGTNENDGAAENLEEPDASAVKTVKETNDAESEVENNKENATNTNETAETTEPTDATKERTKQSKQVVESDLAPENSSEKAENENQTDEQVEESPENSQESVSDTEELKWEDEYILVEGQGRRRILPILRVLNPLVEGIRKNGGDEERYCVELRKRGAPVWLSGWILRQMIYKRKIPEDILRIALEYQGRDAGKELSQGGPSKLEDYIEPVRAVENIDGKTVKELADEKEVSNAGKISEELNSQLGQLDRVALGGKYTKEKSELGKVYALDSATNPKLVPNTLEFWLGYNWNEIYKRLKDRQKEILDPNNHASIWDDFIVYVPREGWYGDESQTSWGNMLIRLMMTFRWDKIVRKEGNTWNQVSQRMSEYYTRRNKHIGGLGKDAEGLYGILWEHTVDYSNMFFSRTSTLIGAYDDFENTFSLDFWGMTFKYSYIVTKETEHVVPKVTVLIDNSPYACTKRMGLLQLKGPDDKYLLDDEWLLHNGLARRTINPQTGQLIVQLTLDRKTGKITAFFQPDTRLWIDLTQHPTDVTEEGMRTESGDTKFEFWRRSAANDDYTQVISYIRKNMDYIITSTEKDDNGVEVWEQTERLWKYIWREDKNDFSNNRNLYGLVRGILRNILGKPEWQIDQLLRSIKSDEYRGVNTMNLLKLILRIPENQLSRVTDIIDKASFMTEHLLMTQQGVGPLSYYRIADMLNYNRWRLKTNQGKEIVIDKTIDNLLLSSFHAHFGQYRDNLGFVVLPENTISERPRDPDDHTMWLSKEKFDPAKKTIAFIDQGCCQRDSSCDVYIFIPIWKSKSEQSLIDCDTKLTITQDTDPASIIFEFWARDFRRPRIPISSCEQELFSRIDSFLVYKLKMGYNGNLSLIPVNADTIISGYDYLLEGSNVWNKYESSPIAINDVIQGLKIFQFAHILLSPASERSTRTYIDQIYTQLQGFLLTNPKQCLELLDSMGILERILFLRDRVLLFASSSGSGEGVFRRTDKYRGDTTKKVDARIKAILHPQSEMELLCAINSKRKIAPCSMEKLILMLCMVGMRKGASTVILPIDKEFNGFYPQHDNKLGKPFQVKDPETGEMKTVGTELGYKWDEQAQEHIFTGEVDPIVIMDYFGPKFAEKGRPAFIPDNQELRDKMNLYWNRFTKVETPIVDLEGWFWGFLNTFNFEGENNDYKTKIKVAWDKFKQSPFETLNDIEKRFNDNYKDSPYRILPSPMRKIIDSMQDWGLSEQKTVKMDAFSEMDDNE